MDSDMKQTTKSGYALLSIIILGMIFGLASGGMPAQHETADSRQTDGKEKTAAIIETAALLLQADNEADSPEMDCVFDAVFTMIAETTVCDENTVCIATSIVSMLQTLSDCAEYSETAADREYRRNSHSREI